jgi:8-oxo-dGTP diphosphatase
MSAGARFVVSVAVVVFRGGRLLALRRAPRRLAAPGAWEVVSGRVEPGEEPLAAARRETREESGLRVIPDPRPVDAYRTERRGREMIVIVYRAGSGSGRVVRSNEHDAHAWMTLAGFRAACRFPPLVRAAERAAAAARRAERRRGTR